MSGRTKQPSFGGVASLFGDDTEEEKPKSRKQQPSFGGVAGLFGDDDIGAAPVTQKKKKAAPSFGGVAAMFGDDNQEPPSQKITKVSSKQAGRKASFGGVASLFGDDDDGDTAAVQNTRNHGKQASFGGVASLFGGTTNAAPVVTDKSSGKQARQQSFGGVASLFGDDDDDAPPATSSTAQPASDQAAPITNLFSSEPKTTSKPTTQTKSDGIGSLPKSEKPKKGRKGKRDPSISGISTLFGADDDQDEQVDAKDVVEKKENTVKEAEIHKDLRKSKEDLGKKAKATQGKIDLAKNDKIDLLARIKKLEEERDSLKQSKVELIKMTAQEMDRMRTIILNGYQKSNTQGAATVS